MLLLSLYDNVLLISFQYFHLFYSLIVDIFFFSEYFFFTFLILSWLIYYYLTLDTALNTSLHSATRTDVRGNSQQTAYLLNSSYL